MNFKGKVPQNMYTKIGQGESKGDDLTSWDHFSAPNSFISSDNATELTKMVIIGPVGLIWLHDR